MRYTGPDRRRAVCWRSASVPTTSGMVPGRNGATAIDMIVQTATAALVGEHGGGRVERGRPLVPVHDVDAELADQAAQLLRHGRRRAPPLGGIATRSSPSSSTRRASAPSSPMMAT